MDRDFNLNRIERYLAVCNASKVEPIIVLSKVDLIEDDKLSDLELLVRERIQDISILTTTNQSEDGYKKLAAILQRGKTYCLLGSSGVGKSTLTNMLLGTEQMQTNSISSSTNKGRHVTSHRELHILKDGAILIDNPGMREVGVIDSDEALETTFNLIHDMAKNCKFKDCTHIHEEGCAVLTAIENGELDQTPYENYLKLEREKDHFESTIAQRRKKDKEFGKMVKKFKNEKRHRGF